MKYRVKVQMKMGTVLHTEAQDIPDDDIERQQKIVLNNFNSDNKTLYLGKVEGVKGYVAINPDSVAFHSFEVEE
jgi:hypothetical protein